MIEDYLPSQILIWYLENSSKTWAIIHMVYRGFKKWELNKHRREYYFILFLFVLFDFTRSLMRKNNEIVSYIYSTTLNKNVPYFPTRAWSALTRRLNVSVQTAPRTMRKFVWQILLLTLLDRKIRTFTGLNSVGPSQNNTDSLFSESISSLSILLTVEISRSNRFLAFISIMLKTTRITKLVYIIIYILQEIWASRERQFLEASNRIKARSDWDPPDLAI